MVAAIGAAGIATALAQTNVYSLNVVGYVNVTIPPSTTAGGFAILCNPLKNGSNTLAEILPNPPVGTRIYRYTGSGYLIYTYDIDDEGYTNWGAGANVVLAPGEGFWVRNPDNVTNILTFVGEVMQGSLTNPIPAGFALRGSMVPQSLILKDPTGSNPDLGYPAVVDETRIYMFKATGGYNICTYTLDDDGNPSWDIPPIPQVAEGFWTREPVSKSWVRSFSVQ